MEPIERITQLGILPCYQHQKAGASASQLKALSDGGILAIEITLRTECGLASIERFLMNFLILVGAGTVLTVNRQMKQLPLVRHIS